MIKTKQTRTINNSHILAIAWENWLDDQKNNSPDLGEASEVEVIELLVNVGEKVKENESLLVLESDKAAMEIPAPFSGIVKEISINLQGSESTSDDILTLEIDNEEDSPSSISADESESKNPKKSKHKQEDKIMIA